MRNRKNKFIKRSLPFRMLIVVCLILLSGSFFKALAQSKDDYPIPETYKTEGVPAIKNSEVENLFYDPASIRSNLIWDADRKNRKMLVTDETNNIYLLDSPMLKPTKLIEKIVPYSVKMRPDGTSFAYTDDHEDQDNYALYLYDFKYKTTKKLISLTGKDESIDSFIWSKKGDSLIYTRVDYDSKISKLCRYNFLEEKCFDADLQGNWNVLDSNENKILLKYWKSSSSQFLYVYDWQLNKLTEVDVKGNSRKAFIVGDRVYWNSEGNEKCKKDPCILSFNLKNGSIQQVNLPENLTNIHDIKISEKGNNLLIQETKDGIDKLRIFGLEKDRVLSEIPPFIKDSYVIWSTRWLSDDEIIYTLENVGKPASIQSYNIKNKQLTDWTKELVPPQLLNKVKTPEIFKWKSFDQKDISGFIVRPQKSEKKSPVLIYVHGGPQILDQPIFNSLEINLSSNLGLTIIHTNIRGSSGFGNEFMDADNKEKRIDAVKDIQSLLDWIEKQPDLDASQIYLRGGSYGGFIVLAAALREPVRVKGVIAEYPLVSIRGLLSESWIDEFAKIEYGDPKDKDLMAKLDDLSPLNNTDRWNKIPLFLTRGKLDQRNPEKDVTDLKTQLQNKGTEVWFIYSANSGHGFGGNYVTAAMYQFLKKLINKEN